MDPLMYQGQKFVVLSTSNMIGGVNTTSLSSFLLLAFLLFISGTVLLFLSKRNSQMGQLANRVN
jgi:hypothetical protein